jgi:S-adenosylmethionine synthetase
MGLRRGKRLEVTVAAAMVCGKIPDAKHYERSIAEVAEEIEKFTSRSPLEVRTKINAADDMKHGSFYLTVTGTSAEQGDDGNTGRGNRVNGLISPMRQYSMEATAGKNPVNHTGKIFNALAVLSAEQIVKEVKGVKECYVRMLSRIGNPIDQPLIASAALVLEKGTTLGSVRGDVTSILDSQTGNVKRLSKLILDGKVVLF